MSVLATISAPSTRVEPRLRRRGSRVGGRVGARPKHASARATRCRSPRRNDADVFPQVTSGGSLFAAKSRVGSQSYNDPINRADPTGLRAQDWEFRDPCWSSGGAQPKGGFGARPYEELESIGYIDFFDLQHQKPFGCVPLPPSRSPGTPFHGVKGPELAVCRSDVAACVMAQYARQIAESDARDYVSGNRAEDGQGGKGNALQHVTWSALMSLFIGRQQAELYLHTHEAANPDTEHGEYNQMDRANNFYGLRLVAGKPCVCLNTGEVLTTGDLAAQAERIASLLRPKVREEVDQGRVCTVAKLSSGGLQLSRGCGQSR